MSGSITVARILELQALEFALSTTSMFGVLNGTLADVPVTVNLSMQSLGGENGSNISFYAATAAPLGMSTLLDRLWPSRPAVLSSFVSGLTFPAMAVTYANASYTVEAVIGAPTQPFLALGSALNITGPAVKYVDSPRAFSMAFTVDILALGINATRATLESAADQVYMQVRRPGSG